MIHRPTAQDSGKHHMVVILLALLLSGFAIMAAADVAVANKAPDDIYNCSDFEYQEDAQAVFNQDPSDQNRLDGDNDGVACEVLPSSPDYGEETPEKTPVILVPGIAGSKLKYAEDVPVYDKNGNLVGHDPEAGDEKWPRLTRTVLDPLDRHLLHLRLTPDGEDPYADHPEYKTQVGEIWRKETALGEELDEYKTTIKVLTEEHGYKEGKDLFVFPYDWRKDLGTGTDEKTQSDELLKKINDIRRETGAERVNILAHSQGGLVTLATLRNPDSVGKVDRVMTLGTPVLGATQSLAVFNGLACFGGKLPILGSCAINSGTTRTLFEDFPAAHQLFPSRAFHEAEGAPVRTRTDPQAGPGTPEDEYDYEVTEVPYEDWSADVGKEGNAGLMEQADTFHGRYDDLAQSPLADSSVELMRVAGAGLATPSHILETSRFCGGNGPCSHTELRYTDGSGTEGGDGTVPLHSADLTNSDTGFDMTGGFESRHARGVEHEDLQKEDSILACASDYFSGDDCSREDLPPARPAGFSTAQVQDQESGIIDDRADRDGTQTNPTSFSGVELQTIGPVQGRVESGNSNVLGTLPEEERGELPENYIVEDIEGGQYYRIGETQSFFLNNPGEYTGELTVREKDDVEIRVKTYEGGKHDGQAVFFLNRLAEGELSEEARVEIEFESGGNPSALRLRIDEDGDGEVERELAPSSAVTGKQAADTKPPTATAETRVLESTTKRGGGPPRPIRARVTLKAEDGREGSGITSIYYKEQGEEELKLYKEPFTVPLGTEIRFGAVDRAGNASPLQEVLVDDTSSALRSAEPISDGDRLNRYIDPRGDEDWFAFEADGALAYKIRLHGLPADYDFALYDEEGEQIASSKSRKKKTEKLTVRPPAGSHYVRVWGHDGAWSQKLPYHLKLDRHRSKAKDGG